MLAEVAPRLELRHIRHRYPGSAGAGALNDVSLTVGAEELVCLLGPSGCGKSTLLRIAAGLEPVQEGVVRMGGQVVADPAAGVWVPPERRNVGLVFQDAALFPHLSVLRNVTFGLDRLPAAEREARARRLLGQLDLDGYAGSYPHQLSGGQQQRVALARALAPVPALVLLDEPFSSLDARLRDRIREDTLQILRSTGTGAMLVTHDPEEALFMADRILLMHAGRIVQAGAPEELYCRPATPFVVRFFGDANVFDGAVRDGAVATPVGAIRAPAFPDGAAVTVMVRPEAFRLHPVTDAAAQPGRQSTRAEVLDSRLLGRFSLLRLRVSAADGAADLRVQVPGVCLPPPGQRLALTLDDADVFVFPPESDAPA